MVIFKTCKFSLSGHFSCIPTVSEIHHMDHFLVLWDTGYSGRLSDAFGSISVRTIRHYQSESGFQVWISPESCLRSFPSFKFSNFGKTWEYKWTATIRYLPAQLILERFVQHIQKRKSSFCKFKKTECFVLQVKKRSVSLCKINILHTLSLIRWAGEKLSRACSDFREKLGWSKMNMSVSNK